MTNTELLPCPFCGGQLKTVNISPSKVGVSCGRTECAAEETWFNNERDAIAAWNRRAPATSYDFMAERWHGECGHEWFTRDGKECPQCAEISALAQRLDEAIAERNQLASALAHKIDALTAEIVRRDALSAAVRAVRLRFVRNSEGEFIDERLIGENLSRLTEISRNGR